MSQTPATRVANPALVEQRHAHLIHSATELFLDQGFHKTSVRQIATAAGWQMGTLYLYISRKEDVLFLIAQDIMDELSSGLLAVPVSDDPRDTLARALDYFFDAVSRMRKQIALLYRESASLLPDHLELLKQSEISERAFLAAIVRSGIEARVFRPIDPDLFSHDAIMLAHMWALKGWVLAREYSFEEYKRLELGLLWNQLEALSGG